MENCAALIIGGSAGSLDVLFKVLPDLRADLSFPVVLVIHRKQGKDNVLTELLNAKTALAVKEAEEKETLKPATIYIAPPGYHLLIENNMTFSLDASEKVNFSRPSIDVTFSAGADVFGSKLVCLLLSGANSDGTAGLQKVSQNGGQVLVQDPATAAVPFMPEQAIAGVRVNTVLSPEKMAIFINNYSMREMINTDKKVFIFDDNLEILDLCTEILEDLGCEVRTSPTTNEVEDQLTDFMPDLILMDNWLPDISGIEATRLIKANEDLKDIPVIYFSANSNIGELAQEAGADDYIAKPFDISHFEALVKKYTGL